MSSHATSQLRPFLLTDKEAVIALWERSGLTRPWNDPSKDIDRKIDELAKGGTGWFWIALTENQIIGTAMAGYEGHRGSVNYLCVDPDSRFSGVGRIIMDQIEADLTAIGCPKINLLVRTDNADVLAFYERLGYLLDDTRSISKRLIED